MYGQFDDDARSVMGSARDIAIRLGHDRIDPEHILVGLTESPTERVTDVLVRLGAKPSTICERVLGTLEPVETHLAPKTLPFTDGAKRVLEHTVEEAARLGRRQVGADLLLLGLLHDRRTVATAILSENGVDLEAARSCLRGMA